MNRISVLLFCFGLAACGKGNAQTLPSTSQINVSLDDAEQAMFEVGCGYKFGFACFDEHTLPLGYTCKYTDEYQTKGDWTASAVVRIDCGTPTTKDEKQSRLKALAQISAVLKTLAGTGEFAKMPFEYATKYRRANEEISRVASIPVN